MGTRRDGDHPSPPEVTIDLQKRELLVGLDGGDVTIAIEEHRVDVLRRLLDRGLSARALVTLFPTWQELIDAVASRPEDRVG